MQEKLEQELAQANSIEEIQEILKNNGAEMTMAEIKAMLNEINPPSELAEDDLDAVAGGAIGPWGLYDLPKKIAKWIFSKFK